MLQLRQLQLICLPIHEVQRGHLFVQLQGQSTLMYPRCIESGRVWASLSNPYLSQWLVMWCVMKPWHLNLFASHHVSCLELLGHVMSSKCKFKWCSYYIGCCVFGLELWTLLKFNYYTTDLKLDLTKVTNQIKTKSRESDWGIHQCQSLLRS